MRLTAIRLSGFKSFADNTVFPVDAPVTGIIGPNGCGKSNIIDAVRWVLGESTAKQLRGQTLTDVIFGGAKNRRAGGMATVSLHFDNSENTAGGAFAEYAEIVIQRRVTSDGQNHYQINQQRCRRKDIVELLQGTGVGARSYAVIEQGMVSRIVESKPEELRTFIEEAAGISLYKNRRKESERKMEQVREHLTRHHDRLQQLGRQRTQLAQEAETARLYREHQTEHSALSHRLISWQLHRISQEIQQLETDYHQEENTLAEAMIAQEQAAKARETAEAQLEAINRQTLDSQASYQHAVNQHHRQETLLGKQKTDYQHLSQRLLETQQRLSRFESQLQEDDCQVLDWQNALTETRTQHQELESIIEELNQQLIDAQQQTEERKNALEQAQRQHDRQQEKLNRATTRRQEAQHRCQILAQRLAEQQHYQPETENEEAVETLELSCETLQITLETQNTEWEQAQSAVANAQARLNQLETTYREALTHYTQNQSRRDTLIEWLPSPATEETTEHPKLYQHLQVHSKWQHAIETLIGTHLQTAISEIPLAEQSYFGKAPIPEQWQPYLNTPADLTPLLAHLTPYIGENLLPNKTYLTPDGEILTNTTRLRLTNQDNDGLLARIEALNTLEQQLITQSEQLNTLEQQHQQATLALQTAQQQEQRLAHHYRETEKQLKETEHRRQLLRQAQQHTQALMAKHQQTLATLQEDLSAAQHQQTDIEIEYAECVREKQTLPDIETYKQQWQQAHTNHQHLQSKQSTLTQQQQQLSTQIHTLQTQLESQTKQQQRLTLEIQETHEQQNQWQQQLTSLEITIEESQLAFETAILALEENETRHQHAIEQQHEARARLQNAKDSENAAKHAYQLAEERLSNRHERLEQLEQQRQEKQQILNTDDRKPLQFPENHQENEAAANKRLRQLKIAMEELGAVNLTAVERYREIDTEYQTLAHQCEDLENSLALLEEAIAQLDNETKSRLTDTFNTVNQHFSQYFPLLFRGGEGSMQWTDNDILTAGISLSVRPPGKKVKNLSVLSGGEKALTAVALVFSFFRLNPAPFCLLDEIDAPLDDANVGRLCALLREMSQQTQFIMITHHKRSMENCDRLIGVTMSEPGVSRLVSVKFEEAN
ncbi:AAA family ATPase [Suttonella ornithocola]|uniref:Chromosome partition protein Smc n=1 Tax=Suttonella ornithocola TaxID=279832 RepID=A0A380MQ37_9GAMM|nr:AAA family ATPase [Suttonella ornithocola]SUO94432.1 Chromosome partition protein Smc [Suttonella ornithocola]